MISHKYKCIFIHIPKCAGTSIEYALGHREGHTGRGGQDHRTIRMVEKPLFTLRTFSSKENCAEVLRRIKYNLLSSDFHRNKTTITRSQFKEYFKFSIVRNPWSRAFSWYTNVMRDPIHMKNYGIKEAITFTGFLRLYAGKGPLRPQTHWLKTFNGSIDLDYIGKFENLEESFNNICNNLKIEGLELPHKLKGSSLNYTSHYNQESTDIIYKVYQEDIDLFGYSFLCQTNLR